MTTYLGHLQSLGKTLWASSKPEDPQLESSGINK